MTTKRERVRQEVVAVMMDHQAQWRADNSTGLPTTIRIVFYELEQRGLAQKPDPSDTRVNRRRSIGWPPGSQDITDAVTSLRDDGTLPWDWFADTERSLADWSWADTVAEYMLDRLDEARINPFGGTLPPLILTESNGMARILRRVAGEYRAPIAGTKGNSAGFLRTVVAPLLDGTDREVLYLGDLDRSGLTIEANSERVLSTFNWNGTWTRVGITPAQTTGITPIVKTDGRDGKTANAWEVESLGQSAIVALVRAALDARMPEPLARVLEREDAEREDVRLKLDVEPA